MSQINPEIGRHKDLKQLSEVQGLLIAMPFVLEPAFGIASESITSLFDKSGPPELPVTDHLPRKPAPRRAPEREVRHRAPLVHACRDIEDTTGRCRRHQHVCRRKFLKRMVARGRPIREANQDSEAARRVRVGLRRSESIEPPIRKFSVRHR